MPSFVLGIDLGTTNSVLAYAPLGAEQPAVELLPIPQLVAAGVVESRTFLPSFLYLAPEHEAKEGAFDLPWRKGNATVVGELARRQSAEHPERTVAGANRGLPIARSIGISRSCRGKRRRMCRRFRR
jgi:molecular chaperone DnaK (HSP70)